MSMARLLEFGDQMTDDPIGPKMYEYLCLDRQMAAATPVHDPEVCLGNLGGQHVWPAGSRRQGAERPFS
jgi:hypothetical protein